MPPKKTRSGAAAASASTRPTRAAAAKVAEAVVAPSTPKSNGKKRAAAADLADSTTPPAKKTAATKPKAAKTAPAQEDEDEDEERELIASLSDVSANSSEEDEDDIQDDANSSDEDEEDDRLAASTAQPRSSLASVKLPNSKDDAVVRARLDKLRKSKSKSTTTPGVLYIGRLPKGFFEKQLKAYFSQFGDVTRLRVSRNKKTGASKHYAFVEFADKDVAEIVQETMHNYLIDGRLLQVKLVPKEKLHPELWIGANRKYRAIPTDRVERVVRSREKSEEEQHRTNQRALKRQDVRKQKLQSLGIDYDFDGYSTQHPPAAAKAKSTKAKSAKA